MSSIPKVMPLAYERIPLAEGTKCRELDSSGKVYVAAGAVLKRSADWGDTWAELYTFASPIYHVRVLNNNDILVILSNGIYKSKDDGVTFSLAYTISGIVSEWGSLSVYDRIVVVNSYHTDHKKIYLSKDWGDTWELIYDCPYNISHFHNVAFDPYEGIIWACSGDSIPRDKIFWSDDYGKTWNILEEGLYVRATEIIPLPKCVLFVSDDHREMYVARHDRPDRGTMGTEVNPQKVFLPKKYIYEATTPLTWGTNACITYGLNGMGFFGWKQGNVDVNSPAIVYATDGYSFTPIWIQEKLPTASVGTVTGICGVFGPDTNNNIVADLRSSYIDDENTSESHIIKISIGNNYA